MIIKSSEIVYIEESEEVSMDELIQSYESNGWSLVLQRQLIDDGTDCPYTWILGFARKNIKNI